ncbi:MAG: hypothetical protein QOK14_561, partial [Frankiaceae bacterium]|nr:hypothetical protein [Frankiaceae bacterium]
MLRPSAARRGPTALLAGAALMAGSVATLSPASFAAATSPAGQAAPAALPSSSAPTTVSGAATSAAATSAVARDRLLVQFATGASPAARARALTAAGAAAPEAVEHTPYVRVSIPGNFATALHALAADPAVADVQQVYQRRVTDLPP